MNKKKVCVLICMVLLLTSICGLTALADGSARRNNIKSHGNINVQNGAAAIYSSDFIYLADEIDALENKYKTSTVAALNNIGTYYDSNGAIIYDSEKEGITADAAVNLSFSQITEGITNSQSVAHLAAQQATDNTGALLYYADESAKKDNNLVTVTTSDTGLPVLIQPIVTDNLTAGTAAWVNGNLIIGNGADNQAYYEQGYIDGYSKITDSVDIEYQYHKHVDGEGNVSTQDIVYSLNNPGGCYSAVGHTHHKTGTCATHVVYHPEVSHTETVRCTWSASGKVENGGMLGTCPNHPSQSYCNDVGGGYYVAGCNGTKTVKIVDSAAFNETVYDCGSPVNTWKIGCGKNTSTIESATIIFH